MYRLIALLALWSASSFAAVPVTVQRLDELTRTPQKSVPATVIARNKPALASEITARIDAIPVRVGDMVDAGTVVARLDCRLYESRLAAAEAGAARLEAQHAFSASQLRRAVGLQAKKGISEETVEQRQADLAGLDAQLAAQRESVNQATLDVERCEIRTPISAVVTARLANTGSLASPGTPLVRLVQLDDLEVSAALREDEATRLALAGQAVFSYAGQDFPVSLRVILPVVDEQARTRESRLVFDGDPAPAGAAGRLQWSGDDPVLPPDYLVRRDGELGVFFVDEGVARFHAVPHALEGRPVEVQLPARTLLVIEGRQRLADGDEITLIARPE
jgi:RND family efflux transporter MFP subunit